MNIKEVTVQMDALVPLQQYANTRLSVSLTASVDSRDNIDDAIGGLMYDVKLALIDQVGELDTGGAIEWIARVQKPEPSEDVPERGDTEHPFDPKDNPDNIPF